MVEFNNIFPLFLIIDSCISLYKKPDPNFGLIPTDWRKKVYFSLISILFGAQSALTLSVSIPHNFLGYFLK